jgi:predicted O-linked N-acetylglucosamine transferase (SPINDLY family)
MLLFQAHEWEAPHLLNVVPDWFLDDYLSYVMQAPPVFLKVGEADVYAKHLRTSLKRIWEDIAQKPKHPRSIHAAHYIATKGNYIPIYFCGDNTLEIMTLRASIVEQFLNNNNACIDVVFSRKSIDSRKIKVGYLNAHFGQQTETHVALSTLRIDRQKFDVCLFALFRNPSPIEDYCRKLATSFELLPPCTDAQVSTLRAAELDVIIIGTNVTAVTNPISLLALHRIAPIQLVNYCSPVSTGMRHVDGYLTGTLNNQPGLQKHFSEKLIFCDGPPGCLDYSVEPSGAIKSISRRELGIADEDIVFINAAACYKILPEMQYTWTKILAAVPKARLLLLPYNPNWSKTFPVKQFELAFSQALGRQGLLWDRLAIAPALPSRADVKGLEALADIYLDTFPFSGSLSVVDALQVGLPAVVWEGETHRSRMASALLRELEIPELIATDEETYISKSVALATDQKFRERMKLDISKKMERPPLFIDPISYGQQLSDILEKLVRNHYFKK